MVKKAWNWIKANERTLSMGLNFVSVGIAVALMYSGDYKKACGYFLMGFIFFALEFLMDFVRKWEVSE